MKNIALKIDWEKSGGLVPAIIQNAQNSKILMLGYMNEQALKKTLQTGKVWFYSRSKKRLWMKGEVSKNILRLIEIKMDCDGDTLLIKANPAGPTCHKNYESCFDESMNPKKIVDAQILQELFDIISSRKKIMPKNSYTTSLFKKGLTEICAKVAEESAEVIKAAKKESKKRVIEESVDVLYHLFVLTAQRSVKFADLIREIAKRRT